MNNIMKLAQEYAVRYRVNRAVDEARADGWVHAVRPDKPKQTYVRIFLT